MIRERCLQLALSIWLGSMVTICGVVAPGMFQLLPDRHLAGTVAGFFFSIETAIGLVLGTVVLVLLLRAAKRVKVNLILAAIAVVAPLVSELGLRPLMQAARDADNLSRFGLLHAGSALLFVIPCVSLLILAWRLPTTTSANG
jgi:hypothetical protein